MMDFFNCFNPKPVIVPQAAVTNDTAFVGTIIDHQVTNGATYVIETGSLADANATFTVLLEEGDDSSLSDASAVADKDLLGTEALASFTYASDSKCFKLGYVGNKRYTRLTITPASNTGDVYVAAVCLTVPLIQPAANPPA